MDKLILALISFSVSFLICGVIPILGFHIYWLISDIKEHKKNKACLKRIDAMANQMRKKHEPLNLKNG
jgi:hypothetical protein